jgi:hypothetical protein
MATVVISDPPTVRGDLVTVTGTVDGVPVTVTCWLSHLNTLPGKAGKQQYLAGLLRAARDAQAPAPPLGVDVSGTMTV